MPQYTVVVYGDEEAFQDASQEDWDSMLTQHRDWVQATSNQGGEVISGDALEPSTAAVTVRTDAKGKSVVSKGSQVNAKENLQGYYVIESPDIDTALTIAKACPAPSGWVEVRPIAGEVGANVMR